MVESKEEKIKEWQKKIIDDWHKQQNLVVFEDGAGNIYAPSTTTMMVTTTMQAPSKKTSTVPPLVNITLPAESHADSLLSVGDTSHLIVVISVTCASLIGLIFFILIVIRCFRRSAMKKKDRISLRRPLNMPEEEHVYAEIEPFQNAVNKNHYEGTSGTLGDKSHSKKRAKNRHRSSSSFNAISTRIYKFFSSDIDSRVVSYDKSDHVTTIEHQLPLNTSERNTTKHKRNHNKAINREESTASQRPFLDRDHSSSLSCDMRNNIYNPLMKEKAVDASEPYASLAQSRVSAGHLNGSSADSDCGRDNFVPDKTVPTSLLLSQDIQDISLIWEETKKDDIPKNHEYFILEPTQSQVNIVKKDEEMQKSINTMKYDPISDNWHSSSGNMNAKLAENADAANSVRNDSDSRLISPLNLTNRLYFNNLHSGMDKIEVADTLDKGEDYELSKLPEAPSPPEIQNDDEYLRPVDVSQKPDYIDVFPCLPPRSTSLQPHSVTEKHIISKFSSLKNNIPDSVIKPSEPLQHGGSNINPFVSQTSLTTKEESSNDAEMTYKTNEHEKNAKNVHLGLKSCSPTKNTKGQQHDEFSVQIEL